jgi:hypothetical protein
LPGDVQRPASDVDRVGHAIDPVQVITAPAVSEATVAPATPIAIPRSASARAGASLTPSPTMTTGASAGSSPSERTTSSLFSGDCAA